MKNTYGLILAAFAMVAAVGCGRAEPKYEGDANILVELTKEPVPDPGGKGGYFVGTVRNKHTYPVAKLIITLRYQDAATRRIVPIGEPFACFELAPNGVTGFSVAYEDYDVEQAKKLPLTIKVTEVRTEEEKIGFDLPKEDYSGAMAEDKKTFTVAGKIKNTTSFRIGDMKVFADFFTDDGIYLGSEEGEVAKGVSDLRPAEPGKRPDSADFNVTYTWTSSARPSTTKLYVRVIGAKI